MPSYHFAILSPSYFTNFRYHLLAISLFRSYCPRGNGAMDWTVVCGARGLEFDSSFVQMIFLSSQVLRWNQSYWNLRDLAFSNCRTQKCRAIYLKCTVSALSLKKISGSYHLTILLFRNLSISQYYHLAILQSHYLTISIPYNLNVYLSS